MADPKEKPENRELPPLGLGPDGEILAYPADQVPEQDVVVVGPDGTISVEEEEDDGGFEDGADL